MEEILFISAYPTPQQRNEGFIQRVKEIDKLFEEHPRTYLDIRFYSSFKKKVTKKGNLTIIQLHLIFHFFTIIKFLRKSKKIFIHSVYSGFRIFPHIFFVDTKKKKICFELHGTFQEELEYKGEKLNSKLFGWFEKQLIKHSQIIVCVSKPFEDYFLSKYPFLLSLKRFIIPVCTSTVLDTFNTKNTSRVIEKFEITPNDVIFVYSGSTEVWQKIDLMFDTINSLLNQNNNYKFFLLTGNIEQMIGIAKSKNLFPNARIYILSLKPEELGNYYELAHYGFVLRDDHILNRVSSPTKFLEYLFFGITPILKSTKIGDFTSYDIEYIKLDELPKEFIPKKSEKNKQIALQILKNYKEELQRLKYEFLSD
ncbi:MAG: hypothetical protein N2560_01790 [Ignavibacteria bacterium]|nr:hypothetical protein [Ignavibacteria bacterium]